jgi:hypothetical protein
MSARPRPPQYARPCRKGLHVIPANVMGCEPCNVARRAAQAEERQRLVRPATSRKGIVQPPRVGMSARRLPPAYLSRGSYPPDEVLAGAACSPLFAYLFDPIEGQGRVTAAEKARLSAAREVCESCPVMAECFADAVKNKRTGVWGGVYLSSKYYERSRKNSAA